MAPRGPNHPLSAGTVRITPLLYLEPVVSVVSAVILLGERVPAATVAGGLLVMAGVVVAGALGPGGGCCQFLVTW
ncbi:MAG: EamA family transporter [Streptosporangiaceae bacterium]